MRRRDLMALLAGAVVLPASCRSNHRPTTIGVAYESLNSEYWIASHDCLAAEIRNRNAVMLEAICDQDANRQLEQVRNFIARRVDGIIIVPTDSQTVVSMLEEVNRSGIPVVLYNRAPVKNHTRWVSVAADNYAITKATVEYLAQEALKKGPKHKSVVLIGDLGDPNAVGRRDGFEDAMKAHAENFEVVGRIPTNWSQEKALAGLTNVLQAHPDVDLIFASSDLLLVAAVSVLKTAQKFKKIGEPGHVLLAGLDGDPNAYRMLVDGYLDAEGVQDVAFETQLAAQAVFDLKAGKQLPQLILDNGLVVHQGNLREMRPRIWGATLRN